MDEASADELQKILIRNKRVEADKAWETSLTRRLCVAALTYIVIVILMFVLGADRPFLMALIPTSGFILSTLSVSLMKSFWLKNIYKAPD